MNSKYTIALAFFLMLNMSFISCVFAHDSFLLPSKEQWNVGEKVEMRMASGLSFPELTWPINQERIDSFIIQLNGDTLPSSLTDGEHFLTLVFNAEQEGVTIVAVSTIPRSGDIKNESAEGYFDEIGAPFSVREEFKALPDSPPLRRSYVKHTKGIICIVSCKNNQRSMEKPIGQKLEFIGTPNVTNGFQLLLSGQPLPNHEVVIKSSTKDGFSHVTDDDGRFIVSESIDGFAMLSAVSVTLPDKIDGVYHSDYATLVIDLIN